MAPVGGFSSVSGGNFEAKITPTVIISCMMAATGGLMFGYDIGISGWVFVMALVTIFLIPETKNIPIEEMTERVWSQHWFWKRFMNE